MKNKETKQQIPCLPIPSIELFDGIYSNGLFTVDKKNSKITMKAGVYILHDAIIFGIRDDTKIENVYCVSTNRNSDLTADHCVLAENDAALECLEA